MRNENENQPTKAKYSQRFKQSWDRIASRALGEDPYQKALQPRAVDSNAELRAAMARVQQGNDQITAGVRIAEAITAQPTVETDPDLAMLAAPDQVVTAADVLRAIDKSDSK